MFREPELMQLCSDGDYTRWLWVMEPVRGEIFGQVFIHRMVDEANGIDMATLANAAYDNMVRKRKIGAWVFGVAEGSNWEAFV